jgi:DNA helicase II / ATP-dependent DNA helicase PcrA
MNHRQAEVVGFPFQGAVLVLAGAGSGKTTVLTRRIGYLLECFPRTGILALTFTKDAAHEMSIRLRQLLGPAAATVTFPTIGTFHAFAYRLIRSVFRGEPNWSRLGFARSPSLLEPSDRSAWLRSAKKEAASAVPLETLEEWVANPFADEGSDDHGTVDEGALVEENAGDAEARNLRRRFRHHLLETGSVAFDDMVSLAARLLKENPELLSDARSRYPRILVDEFQDTSRDQLDLVKLLAGEKPSLLLVGDDDQAIYGFRGADPGNIGAALDHFPGMRILKLEINYRSSAPIVEYSNSVFSDKPARLRKRLEAGRSLGSVPVRRAVHRTGADQAAWMVGEMERLRKEEGLAWKDMAILFRLNVLEPYYRSMLMRLAGPEAAAETILSTVHAAKGLEYPAVFFAGLEDGILPYRRGKRELPPDRLAEERRIFYVGVTRAQRFLYLCSCRRRVLRGKTVEAKASPFLRRAGAGLGSGAAAAAAGIASKWFGTFRAWGRKKGVS